MPASIYVVSAIGGNMWRESHVNPALWENLTPGSPGYGLCQWTNERRIALFQYLNGRGLPNSDGDGQCDYLVVENDWIDSSASPLHYPNLQAFLNTDNQNIPYLTETFMRCWERPGVPALDERVQFAQKAYAYLLVHGNSQVDWILGNRYLSEAEALNNMCRVWQKLGKGSPGPGPGPGPSLGGWRWGAAREIYRRLLIHE